MSFLSSVGKKVKATAKNVNAVSRSKGLGNVMMANGMAKTNLNPIYAVQSAAKKAGVDLGVKNKPAAQPYKVPAKPADPTFQSAQNASGNLKDPYTMTAQQAQQSMAGTELRNRAMATGPSAWANLQTQQQGLEEQNARNSAAQQAAGQNAQAESQLAMRGGMGSGSRERLAAGSAWNQMAAGQGIANQGMQNRLNIGIADQEQKNAMLGQAAGLGNDLQKFNASQTNTARGMNVGNALTNLQSGGQFGMDKYKIDMAARGATQNANAMLAAAPQQRSMFWQFNDPLGLAKGVG